MSIGLAIIARDEEQSLPTLLASIKGAFDRVVLLDTGSEDNTVGVFDDWCLGQRAGEQGSAFSCEVGRFEWIDDFAAARNAADALLLGDGPEPLVDWTSWADCDDIIRGAEQLRSIAQNAPPMVAGLVFGYDYAQHPATGTTVCHLRRERLVRAGRGKWGGRVHEAQHIDGGVQLVPDEVVQWVHQKQALSADAAISSNERNLRILLKWVEDEPDNPRVLAYCGKELAARGEHDRALEFYERFMKVPSGWREERAQVYRHYAASLMEVTTDLDKIEALAWEALRALPSWPDSWLTLAECYSRREQHHDALWCVDQVLRIGNPTGSMLILNPLDYTAYPHRLAAGCYGAMKDYDQAIEHAEKALAVHPADDFLRAWWAEWKSNSKREHTASTYAMCAEQLIAHDEQLKARTLLEECVPVFAQDHPRIVQLRAGLRKRLAWVDDPEAFTVHYQEGGSKPEDFHDDETSDRIAQQLPRVAYLIEGLMEQGAEPVEDSHVAQALTPEQEAVMEGMSDEAREALSILNPALAKPPVTPEEDEAFGATVIGS